MTTSSGLSKPNMYKISRGRTLNGEPNPIDVYIGQRIRVRRQLLGLSQEALAKKIGITFQQVQKYERGMNRIGASRPVGHDARCSASTPTIFSAALTRN